MAIAQRFLADRYNRPHHEIVDSLDLRDLLRRRHDGGRHAGGRVDRRPARRSAGSSTSTTTTTSRSTARPRSPFTTEDKGKRFEAYGWHVQHVDDAEDLDALAARSPRRKAEDGAAVARSIVRSHIAYRRAERDRHGEGARLAARRGRDPRRRRRRMGFDPDAHFAVPDAVLRAHGRQSGTRGPSRSRSGKHALRRVGGGVPRPARGAGARPARRAARRLARRAARLPGRARRSRRATPARR